MAQNPFLKPSDTYHRQIDPIGQYVDQMAQYLVSMTGDPLDVCKQYIRDGIKQGTFPNLHDPKVRHYERLENGDRSITENRLSQYIHNVITHGDILAPSFTVYLHPQHTKSIYVAFTEKNKKLRSIAKEKAHKAKAEGNLAEYTYQENVQSKKKIYNNAMSGSFGTEGTIMHNPTAHSTLTSITRTVVSLCNATNERMLAGNRHYWSPDIALNNLISITAHTDSSALQAVLDRYGLICPTVEQTMQVVQYSTDLYWRDQAYLDTIRTYVEQLTPLQRASCVYTGDFYHLRVFNAEAIRLFLATLSRRCTESVDDPLQHIPRLNADVLFLAHQVCADLIKGMGKDYSKMQEAGVLETVVGTALHIERTITEHRDFIEAFFLTDNLPPSIAEIPHMLRRVVPLSDTDSSCFSTDKWVEWYRPESTETALAIASTVAYLTTQTMAHILAILSANINTPLQYLHTLAVKGEYIWDAFLLTNRAKHYAARPIYQEGSVFAKPEYETKGVHLISSASPTRLIQDLHGRIRFILDTVAAGEQFSIVALLKHIADMERSITQSLLTGDEEFYRTMMIKDAAGYVLDPTKSPFQYYLLWQEVFQPKYGEIEPPPYVAIKIPTSLNNKTEMKTWLEHLPDQDFAQRFQTWALRNKKTAMGVFMLPLDYIQAHGIPEELRPIMDTKRVVLELTNGYRLILETLGFYTKKKWLLSEMGY